MCWEASVFCFVDQSDIGGLLHGGVKQTDSSLCESEFKDSFLVFNLQPHMYHKNMKSLTHWFMVNERLLIITERFAQNL